MVINKISAVIPQETEDQLMLHAKAFTDLLPWLKELQPEERIRMSKYSRKRGEIIERTEIHAVQNPTLMPQYANLAEYLNDVHTAKSLMRLNAELTQVQKRIKDTIMLLQSDAYHVARAFYKTVQTAHKHGVPGTEKILEELSFYFKRKPAKKDEESKNGSTNENGPEIETTEAVEVVKKTEHKKK